MALKVTMAEDLVVMFTLSSSRGVLGESHLHVD